MVTLGSIIKAIPVEDRSILLEHLHKEAFKGLFINPATMDRMVKFKHDLREAYQHMFSKLPFSNLDRIIRTLTMTRPKEAVDPDIAMALAEWAAEEGGVVSDVMVAHLTEEITAGAAGWLSEIAEEFSITGVDPEKAAAQISLQPSIAEKAKSYVSLIENDLSEKAINLTGDLIEQGLKEGLHPSDIVRNIRDLIDDPTVLDSDLERIVRTETNRALSEGRDLQAKAIGAKEKEWITVGDNRVDQDVCIPCELEGWIPVGEVFTASGTEYPPGHPNCRCDVVYRGVDRDRIEEELRRLGI